MLFQGEEPTRAYADDAGFDLEVEGNQVIYPRSFAHLLLKTQVQAIDSAHWHLLIGRSSTFKNRGLLMNPGIIDPGYSGPLYAVVFNLGVHATEVKDGERIAQLIPMANIALGTVPQRVERFRETERGELGFGSSGA
jgi:dUTP pyrophosphatase